jgi:hypothetical protein
MCSCLSGKTKSTSSSSSRIEVVGRARRSGSVGIQAKGIAPAVQQRAGRMRMRQFSPPAAATLSLVPEPVEDDSEIAARC